MGCFRIIERVVGYACTLWCIAILAFCAVVPESHCQEQFERPLENDARVTSDNLKVVNCRSAINRQFASDNEVLSEGCTVTFKDGSTFDATLRYCRTFEQCEGAGGKFKDILIRVLRTKHKLQSKLEGNK
jgi:hypothetical protein